ncbi:hypothetical protein C8R44DRAFT_892911 [Mycena epipterygia]|nr:hypothetical protein C8R44DRAFT_892911 [Mycena epipterygia]
MKVTELRKNSNGIGSFFPPIAKSKLARLLPPQVLATPPPQIKKIIPADTLLNSNYFISVSVYTIRRNIFQHMAPSQCSGGRSLALFTHAPISELVYLLTGARLSKFAEDSEGMYSISAGDSRWEHWDSLNSNATVYRILNVGDSAHDSEDEDEDDYEEPDEGSGSKKRRPKAPRGAAKKQKMHSGPKQKPRKNTAVPKLSTKSKGQNRREGEYADFYTGLLFATGELFPMEVSVPVMSEEPGTYPKLDLWTSLALTSISREPGTHPMAEMTLTTFGDVGRSYAIFIVDQDRGRHLPNTLVNSMINGRAPPWRGNMLVLSADVVRKEFNNLIYGDATNANSCVMCVVTTAASDRAWLGAVCV